MEEKEKMIMESVKKAKTCQTRGFGENYGIRQQESFQNYKDTRKGTIISPKRCYYTPG
jgi:hypothetical protein